MNKKPEENIVIRLFYIQRFFKYNKLWLKLVITVPIGNLKEIILKDVIAHQFVLVYLS
jgi:hypothetical protein